MAKAIDVAKFFIEIVANTPNEDAMTNLRLNKLLINSHYHLQRKTSLGQEMNLTI